MAKKINKPKTILGKVWYFLWHDDSPLAWVTSILIAFLLIKFVLFPVMGLVLGTTYPAVAVVSGSMDHGFTRSTVCSADNAETCIPEARYALCGFSSEADRRVTFDDWWTLCGTWYEDSPYGAIQKEEFEEFHFKNGFSKGDIIVLRGKSPEDIAVGEVIVYDSQQAYPIIHRVVAKRDQSTGIFFTTKGDHNSDIIRRATYEENINQDQVIGVAWFRIPYVGWLKIIVVDWFLLPILKIFI